MNDDFREKLVLMRNLLSNFGDARRLTMMELVTKHGLSVHFVVRKLISKFNKLKALRQVNNLEPNL